MKFQRYGTVLDAHTVHNDNARGGIADEREERMTDHESDEVQEAIEPEIDDLELSKEEEEEIKGGGFRMGRPEGPQPHL